MFGVLKKLFGGGGDGAGALTVIEKDPVEYKGYRIVPTPRKEAQGLRVAGRIEKDVDGETLVHEFVRADVYYSEDDTVPVIVHKAERLIEEQGDRLFAPWPAPTKAPEGEGSTDGENK